MKYNFKLLFISYLICCIGTVKAQTPSPGPAGVVIASPQSDSRAIAVTGGKTWNYTNPAWPAFSSPCNFFGFRDTLYQTINGYNTLPPNSACANMANVIYDAPSSNLAGGIVVYIGSTTYYYQNTSFSFQTAILPVRVTIKFTTPASVAIPVTSINLKKLIKANQNFNVSAIIEVLSPANGIYFAGGGNTYTPAITLFDNLHTDPNSSICTSLNQGTFFTFTVIPTSSNTGPYCAGQTISLSSSATAQAGGAITYSWGGPSYTSTAQNPTIASSTAAMSGTYTVTATDIVGCPGQSTTTVVVQTTPAFAGCPVNINTNVDVSSCNAVVSWTPPTLTGTCPATVTSNYAPGDAFPVGSTTVTYTATTGSGTTATCSFNVTVTDNISPVIACPSNISVNAAAGTCAAVVNFTPPVGTDNCAVTTVRTAGLASGSSFPVGTTTQTYTATDASGNATTCSFTITVNDTQAPSITCNANIVVGNTSGQCSAIVTFTPPVGTDNCSGVTTTQTAGLASGATFPIGTTTETFRATDAAGNVTSCSFTITVNDTQAPSITCNSNITTNSGPGQCGRTVIFGAPAGTDNCAGVTTVLTAGQPSGTLFPVGTTTETFTATDAAGNSTSCSFTITINDNQAPSITCNSNIVVSNTPGQCGAVVTFTPPVGADNCGGATTTQTAGLASGSLFQVGVTTETFRVTDASGNTTSCSFTVTVNDTEAPSITCNSNITVSNTAGQCGAIVTFTPPVGTDNCSGATTTQTTGLASGSLFPVGITTETFRVTDAAGNTTSCSFTITVNDTEAPSITCNSNITVSNTAVQCGALVAFTPPVGTDNCAGVTTTQTAGLASGAFFPIGITTETFRATDAAGNTTSCSFTITVNDTQAPSITCNSNITVNNTAGQCGAVVTFTPPAGTDNCSGATTTQTAGLASGSVFPVGTTTETFRVTDASGNTTSCSFTITVTDTEAPSITCNSNIAVSNTTGQCGTVVNFTPPVGTDNCGSATTTQTAGLASGSLFPVGVTTETFRVTDASGNIASCSFTITVTDTEAPAIICNPDIAVGNTAGQCGAVVTFTPPAGTDNCTGAITTQTAGLASGSLFPIGVTTETFTVTDAAGNITSCSFTITVTDTEAPAIICNSNVALNNDAGQCGAVVTFTPPVGTDNCAGAATTQTAGLASGSLFPIGTTTQTFTVIDAAGNTNSCSFNVVVTDTELPVITCNTNISLNNDAGQCGAIVNFAAPAATDNCTLSVIQTAGLASGSLFPIGITTQTFTATDPSGNTASCSFTITVTDTELPVISCNSNIAVNNDAGQCGAIVNFTPPAGTDNCAGVTTAQTAGLVSGSLFPIGTTTQTFTVTDASGNTASCSFNVAVTDTELPVISCNANIAVSNDAGQCGAVVTFTPPTGTDNCTSATTVQTTGLASGSLFPIGTTTQTFTVTDASGNTASCSFNIAVTDTELPVISCNSNIAVSNDAGQCGAIVNFTPPAGTDNCAGATTLQTAGLASGSLFPAGTTTQTFTVTDAAGNSSSCSFDVTVTDTELPSITCNANVTVNNDAGQCGAVVNFAAPSATDNCTLTIVQTAGLASGSLFPIGITTQTFTATDPSGNTASCSFTITVTDNETPVITCNANIATGNDAGQCGAIVNFTPPAGTDNCAGVTTAQTAGLPSGSLFPIGTTTQTFSVTDASGNTASCSFNVVVTDTELPVIICNSNIAVNNDAGQCGAIVNFTPPTGTDNCLGVTTTQTAGLPSGSLFPAGTTIQTFTVTDAAGNTSSCSFNVVVTDSELPVISCNSNVAVNNDAGQCGAVVNFAAATATDNCSASITQTAGLASGSLFPIGTTTQTFTATDPSGNTVSCSYTITVTDTEAPVITCNANIAANNDAGQCGAVVTFTPPAGTDNCAGVTTTQTAGLASGSLFPTGTTTQTFTTTDAAGNTVSCSFNVVVTDTELPVIVCNPNIAVNNDPGQCGAIVNFTPPTGTDNCSGITTTQTAGLASGSLFPIGTTTQTFTTTDAAGNTASCSFTVIVTDTELPVIICNPNIAVNNDAGQCGAVVNFTPPTGTDNCSGVITLQTAGLASGSLFPTGTTTQTFTTTDAAGNTVSCSFNVVVTDTEMPVITCNANIAQNNDAGQCGAVVTFAAPAATDNCTLTITQTAGLTSGSLFPNGVTTQTFTATDPSGNTVSCSFTVTITDTEAPVVSCTSDIAACDNGSGNIVTYTTPTATDNCAVATVTQTSGLPSGSSFPLGITTNTFVFTDAAGNTGTCTFTVTVNPPVVITFTGIAPLCETDNSFTLVSAAPAGGTYSGPGVAGNLFDPALTGTGTFTILYTVNNSNGCSATGSTTVTVNATPVVTLSNFAQVSISAAPFTLSGGLPTGGIYSGAGISSAIFSPGIAGAGIHQVTYTYTNASGCSDTATASIEVIDDALLIVYNALTPNGDGVDDAWTIKNIDNYPGNKVQIFNRWGTKVYSATNYKNNWTGGDLPDATYFYILDLNNGDKALTGTVTIIR